jgi:hypothetical protein
MIIIVLNNTTIKAKDEDSGKYIPTKSQSSIYKIAKKGTGSEGSSDLNLDALGKEINNVSASSEATTAINKVLGVVTVLIVTAAIILLTMKGVAFMQAAPEGKAEIKKQLIAIVVGGVIIFGINTIIQTIITVSTTIIK